MAKTVFKFRFKKQNKGAWDLYEAITVGFGKKEVGYIQEMQGYKWRVRLQVAASEKALADNPNCPWMWATVKTVFESAEAAKEWLNKNCEMLVSGVCYIEKGEQK